MGEGLRGHANKCNLIIRFALRLRKKRVALHLCNEARQQKVNEMESLKDLIAAQKLLKFEISQTKKAKELAAIEAAIAEAMSPAKERAKKIAARTGRNEGKMQINGETAKYKVTLAQVKAHERTSVRIDMV